MKIFFTFLAVGFLVTNFALAQDPEPSPTICEVSKSCKKACEEKAQDDHDDDNSTYQQLLLKCAEDVAKNLQLIK
ncbi:MAG: hypothetical protein KA100_03250 [Rickettsiales bacterium]|nr:hypothetical protein [Rickettsiales bacterium]